jgi:hypothetical protein
MGNQNQFYQDYHIDSYKMYSIDSLKYLPTLILLVYSSFDKSEIWQRSRILDILKSVGFIKFANSRDLKDLNRNSSKISIIRSALITGLYPDVLRVDKLNNKFLLEFVTFSEFLFAR